MLFPFLLLRDLKQDNDWLPQQLPLIRLRNDKMEQ